MNFRGKNGRIHTARSESVVLSSVVDGSLRSQEFLLHLYGMPVLVGSFLKMDGIPQHRARRVVLDFFLVNVLAFRFHLFP